MAGCLLISRLLASQLFGVGATDPLTLLSVAVGLMVVCLAASAIPALRAVRIDPLWALRRNG
jgi:ABC-type lipoprotein release transport system permease subunit